MPKRMALTGTKHRSGFLQKSASFLSEFNIYLSEMALNIKRSMGMHGRKDDERSPSRYWRMTKIGSWRVTYLDAVNAGLDSIAANHLSIDAHLPVPLILKPLQYAIDAAALSNSGAKAMSTREKNSPKK